jgi:hypothetical protein
MHSKISKLSKIYFCKQSKIRKFAARKQKSWNIHHGLSWRWQEYLFTSSFILQVFYSFINYKLTYHGI